MDKNQAVIDYLIQCPAIKNSPLYFNFINAKDNNKEIVTLTNDKSMNRTYIDGSVLRRYTFTIIAFKSMTSNPIVKQPGYTNENVEDMLDVQGVIDWITEQNEILNFPNFGEGYLIDEIQALSDNPGLNGVDSNVTPALAKYSISIRIQYLDYTKKIWKETN